jgi:hypothetical protein
VLAFSSFALYISVARQGSKLRDVQRQDGAVTWQGTDAVTGLMQMQGTFVGRAAHLEEDEMVKDAACIVADDLRGAHVQSGDQRLKLHHLSRRHPHPNYFTLKASKHSTAWSAIGRHVTAKAALQSCRALANLQCYCSGNAVGS